MTHAVSLPQSTSDRHLEVGDFASLNELWMDATIAIPGDFQQEIPSTTTSVELLDQLVDSVLDNRNVLDVNHVQCSNLMMGDVLLQVVPQQPQPQQSSSYSIQLDIVDWDWDCQADYRYELIGHSGTLKLFGRGSNAMMVLSLVANTNTTTTTASDNSLPNNNSISSQLDSCTVQVNLEDIELEPEDSILMNMLEFVMQLVRGPIQTALSHVICDELESMGTVALPNLLSTVTSRLQPYLQPPVNNNNNSNHPLHQEQMLLESLPTMTTINGHSATTSSTAAASSSSLALPFLDFQPQPNETTTTTSAAAAAAVVVDHNLNRLVVQALDMLQTWLSSSIPTNNNNRTELGINGIFRDMMILDDTGALILDMTPSSSSSSSPLESMLVKINNSTSAQSNQPAAHPGNGRLLLNSHDRFLETNITLDQIIVYGLDSMTQLDLLQPMGHYTLQNKMAWQFLQVTMDLTIVVALSTLPDSLWTMSDVNANAMDNDNTKASHIMEHVQFQVNATNVQAASSILLAIYQDRLQQVSLGSHGLEFHSTMSFVDTVSGYQSHFYLGGTCCQPNTTQSCWICFQRFGTCVFPNNGIVLHFVRTMVDTCPS